MLQKKKCCFDDDCFDRSERLFHEKMTSWSDCSKTPKPCTCHDEPECLHHPLYPDHCDEMELAMAYVKPQKLNPDTLKTCTEALQSGTLFKELDRPFQGGVNCDE